MVSLQKIHYEIVYFCVHHCVLFFHHRPAIQKVLDNEMCNLQDKLKDQLSCCQNVSITMDIWSDSSMRGYLGLTAHFIINDKLCSQVLGVPRFEGMN